MSSKLYQFASFKSYENIINLMTWAEIKQTSGSIISKYVMLNKEKLASEFNNSRMFVRKEKNVVLHSLQTWRGVFCNV